ncbi:MAG: PilW family protein [Gammaproteobacteria bacterium]|nr:PilW family protein [Gammaproteobacteria bacterium]
MKQPHTPSAGRRPAQRGVSLVEIMVALVIGLVLTTGIIQLFLGSKQTYRFQDALSRVQENARFAIDALHFDVRMAGNLGCTAFVPTVNSTLNGPPSSFDPGAGIQGWEANGTAPGDSFALPVANAAVADASAGGWTTSGGAVLDAATMALPGSDIVRIWRGDSNLATINSITPGASGALVVNTTPNASFGAGDILLLSDCQNIDWVQACSVDTSSGTSVDATLSTGCSPGNSATANVLTQPNGHAVKLESFIYYVGKRNDAPDSPPGLFRRPLGITGGNSAAAGAAEEVVEGVENMQILYGIDTNADRIVDSYVTADAVNDWRRVTSVRIALLMRATGRGDDISGAATHTLAGSNATATADGHLRQVVNTTIALRNRVP